MSIALNSTVQLLTQTQKIVFRMGEHNWNIVYIPSSSIQINWEIKQVKRVFKQVSFDQLIHHRWGKSLKCMMLYREVPSHSEMNIFQLPVSTGMSLMFTERILLKQSWQSDNWGQHLSDWLMDARMDRSTDWMTGWLTYNMHFGVLPRLTCINIKLMAGELCIAVKMTLYMATLCVIPDCPPGNYIQESWLTALLAKKLHLWISLTSRFACIHDYI